MMPRASLRVLALAVVVGACADKPDLDEERTALMATSREWAQAAASGDLERIVFYWADDAIVLPPDQPAVVGKEAIREYVRQGLAVPGFRITWEPEFAAVSPDGSVGWLVERNQVSFTDSTGFTRSQYGKAVTIWRKEPGGAWKCVIDTWNNNPTETALPAGPPQAATSSDVQ